MKIKGLQKVTLIDYPGKIAATIFLYGCNFRCGFCHNPELVLHPNEVEFNPENILNFLAQRKKYLEGVCFTGGEPLMTLEPLFLKQIKKLGYDIKIDTNGSYPQKLKDLIKQGLIDFISMDIKASPEKYPRLAGAEVNLEKIEQSLKLIVNSGLDYEFRTTILEDVHTKKEMVSMAEWLYSLVGQTKKFCLQGFKNQGKLLDDSFLTKKDTSEKFLSELRKELEKKTFFEQIEIRV